MFSMQKETGRTNDMFHWQGDIFAMNSVGNYGDWGVLDVLGRRYKHAMNRVGTVVIGLFWVFQRWAI